MSDNTQPIKAHEPAAALWLSTLAFTVCFAIWTIFAIIGIRIKQELGLTEAHFGLLIGTPILTGSLIRILLGVWTTRYGGRLVYTLTMLAAAAATFLLSYATTYTEMLIAGLGVGLAGGSFAVGVAYVSPFFPPEKQGTALGIFGAGNVGAAVTKFVAPFVLVAWGWQAVAEIWAAALALMAVVFWFTTTDDPAFRARRDKSVAHKSLLQEFAPLRNAQVWRFSLYYFFAFGGFVALSLWLPRYLVGVYGFDLAVAGMIAAAYSVPGSVFRVLGGVLSDRKGARSVMYGMLAISAVCTLILSLPLAGPPNRAFSGGVFRDPQSLVVFARQRHCCRDLPCHVSSSGFRGACASRNRHCKDEWLGRPAHRRDPRPCDPLRHPAQRNEICDHAQLDAEGRRFRAPPV